MQQAEQCGYIVPFVGLGEGKPEVGAGVRREARTFLFTRRLEKTRGLEAMAASGLPGGMGKQDSGGFSSSEDKKFT